MHVVLDAPAIAPGMLSKDCLPASACQYQHELVAEAAGTTTIRRMCSRTHLFQYLLVALVVPTRTHHEV